MEDTRQYNTGGLDASGMQQNNWLPLTESISGNAYTVTCHLLCSGIQFQVLLLPVAFATLGWSWGIICLSLLFAWQLYTTWLLVHLQEAVPGIRHTRYLRLAIAAFGPRLGKLLGIFPLMYLSGGFCILLIITGGEEIQNFLKLMAGDDAQPLSGTVCFLVFTCVAILMAQFPNLNSITGITFIGAIISVTYCTLLWVLPLGKTKINGDNHTSEDTKSVMFAIAIYALAFRGHNVVLEIQGTLPSNSRYPTHRTMWRAVAVSYVVVGLCVFPLAMGGFWAYGDKIPADGALAAFSEFHGQGGSKFALGTLHMLLILSSLCSFQIYAMVVFDNLEFIYTTRKKTKCSRLVRAGLRLSYGGVAFFVAMLLPFWGKLAPVVGSIALPVTYSYPCLMWVIVNKPQGNNCMWYVNIVLGCLGIVLSLISLVVTAWHLVDVGFHANFFNP